MRKLIAVAVVFAIGLGIAMAEDVRGTVKTVEGDKLTITVRKKGEKTGEDKTYVVPASAKVTKGTFNKDTKKVEAGDALDGGLKNEAVKAGAGCVVSVDGDKVSAVMITPAFGKKKKTE